MHAPKQPPAVNSLLCSVRVRWDPSDCVAKNDTAEDILTSTCSRGTKTIGLLWKKNRAKTTTTKNVDRTIVMVLYGRTSSKSMDQSGKVANPARGQLNRENEYFPVHDRALEFSLARRVRQSRPASACSSPYLG